MRAAAPTRPCPSAPDGPAPLPPLRCGGDGWALLGEFAKFVPVSSQRIAAVRAKCAASAAGDGAAGRAAAKHAIEVDVVGAAGEQLELGFVSPAGAVSVARVRLGEGGVATVVRG